jgi:chromosome segregation ATPase
LLSAERAVKAARELADAAEAQRADVAAELARQRAAAQELQGKLDEAGKELAGVKRQLEAAEAKVRSVHSKICSSYMCEVGPFWFQGAHTNACTCFGEM